MRLRLMKYDSDLFNRYDVGHQYALDSLVHMYETNAKEPDMQVIEAMGTYLKKSKLDKAFIARAIVLPSEEEIFEKVGVADMKRIKAVRLMMRRAFAEKYKDILLKIYKKNQSKQAYSPDNLSFGKRAIKNVALGYLALVGFEDLAKQQFDESDNLTDRLSALNILVNNDLPSAEQALKDFYQRYENDDLVLNKWFAVQARNGAKNTLPIVEKLVQHKKFDIRNPNKVRAVIGAFGGNLESFHTLKGYEFFVKHVMEIDKINPHLAARLFTAFAKYRKFDESVKESARKVLRKVAADKTLSDVSRETVERMI